MKIFRFTLADVAHLSINKKLNFGFTLAEVLIVIGVIGVVAAITLPTLIASYQEKVFVEKLRQTYTIFSNAYQNAIAYNGSTEYWGINGNARELYNKLTPYLKITKDCTTDYSGCYPKDLFYKHLNGAHTYFGYTYKPHPNQTVVHAKLNNGVVFSIICSKNSTRIGGGLTVDLNGPDEPNQAGIDMFHFAILPDRILPYSPSDSDPNHICKYGDNKNQWNGYGCAGWVLQKGNMDYLRRDISDEY